MASERERRAIRELERKEGERGGRRRKCTVHKVVVGVTDSF